MPYLRHVACTFDDCDSSDGMALYEEEERGVNGFCWACNRYEAHPLGKKKEETPIEVTFGGSKEPWVPDVRFLSLATLPSKADSSRALSDWAMAYFGVKTELSESDGTTVTAHYYPYTKGSDDVVAYKHRELPKKFSTIGDFKSVDLFGLRQALNTGGRKVFITEGEIDCVSVFQALKSFSKGGEWADLNPAVVSLPNGGAAALAAITRNLDQLRKFEHIVLVMDNDEVGQKAKADILKLVPEALTVTLDEKDPNAMVMKGKNVNLAKACLFQAQRQRPSSIASVSDLRARALAKPAMGLSWPWPTLTKETYGIHTKKLYVIGAGVGLGKSEVVNEVVAHLIYEHDAHVGVFKLEEDGGRTLKGLAGKRDGVVYHNPEIPYDEEKLIESIDALEGKLLVYDHFGVKEWEDLKPAIRYMVVTEGVKHIFLDPLTAVVSGLSSGEANDKLNQIMGDLSGMTHELDFSCYVISHLNLPDKGLPHELGGKALESQMTGSRAMMKYAHYIFMLQGNKDPELPEDARNCRELVCRKDREFGRVFTVDMFYDNRTGLLRERAVKFGNY